MVKGKSEMGLALNSWPGLSISRCVYRKKSPKLYGHFYLINTEACSMVNQELLAVIYGLVSASLWGTSGFSGGFVTKTSRVFGVVLVAYIAGVALLTIRAPWAGEPAPDIHSLIFSLAAGIAGFIGLAAVSYEIDGNSGTNNVFAVFWHRHSAV
ncbi:MAG: hypothetical protein GY850_27245 [bacterium]|nr:hypothetical protein [bacterium]